MIVLKRNIYKPNKPPCCVVELYSLDNGKTWIDRIQFYRWQQGLVTIQIK